ncbi:hypothetical protein Harreka1_44 [Olleya phage Harreka_1]|uniref:Uncharacterized protein n=1 Tax=Olleya phage Harreka_1 TaxID=2745673 RepID=A0A8E4ZJU7_9CAUD|nr:hypothetical protein M1M26_gp44 [Olleya phage Harreka_1]QQV90451.1 hypothetical protein Harreka1_44 [Olleya phage Harreka_1]
MKTHDIKLGTIPLTIEGIYHKGREADYDNIGCEHEFKCFNICAGGVNITDLLTADTIIDIEMQVLTENY